MLPAISGWQMRDNGENGLPVSPSLGTRAGTMPKASRDRSLGTHEIILCTTCGIVYATTCAPRRRTMRSTERLHVSRPMLGRYRSLPSVASWLPIGDGGRPFQV